jgi:iron(III) transport system ATP-binding protein
VSSPRLEIRNLVRSFGGRRVVDGASLCVAAGEVTCLLGPSGCGKSTTLRIIAGVETQDAGDVLVDGDVISGGARHVPPEQRGIGLMFQDFALFPHLSVAENVAYGLRGTRADRAARVDEMLSRVHMQRFAQAYPHQLSGGEQQRIALARALAPKPRIMLMDEPFSGLDNRLRDGIRDDTLAILKEADTAVLLVTHEPDEALRMADQIALMRDGQIIQAGKPYEVYTHPADLKAMTFFSEVNVLRGRAHGGQAETAFGAFDVSGIADESEVEIAVRPQHVRIDYERSDGAPATTSGAGRPAAARVVRARFLGSESLVEFKLKDDQTPIKAIIPGVFMPEADRVFWLRVDRRRSFAFPAEAP